MVQLDYTIQKEVMFKNHTYVSGTTKTLAKHFYELAESNAKYMSLKKTDLIIDIGGNDGTQLIQYKKLGFSNLLNIESADNIAALSKASGIPTFNMFFNEDVVSALGQQEAKLINASGVFFHMEEIHSALRAIKKILARNGILVIQFMYLGDIIKNVSFDAIYHEHLMYYSLESLSNLLAQYDLRICDAFHSDIHGGSMMVRACHMDASYKMTQKVEILINSEKCTLEDLFEFAFKVNSKRFELKKFLQQLKSKGFTIYGYGAPAKSTTLLNYMQIDNSILDKLVEVNELKCGRYSPGTHIPIVMENENDIPDFYLMLAWNFQDEILKRNKGKKITWITPFPEIILHRTDI